MDPRRLSLVLQTRRLRDRVPRKLRAPCTAKIEACGKNALRWFRVGRSPLPPHGLIAPFGTKPCRAWSATPTGQRTDGVIEVSDSDDDAAAHHAMAAGFRGAILARIDGAASPLAASASLDDLEGDADETAAQARPGHDERLAWAVSARAY